MSMTYAKRMTIAAIVSVLLHAVGIGVLYHTHAPAPPLEPPAPEPIVLNLQPEPPPEPPVPKPARQLVDIAQPAPAPPPPTDRIAEADAEAMDLAARPDANAGPQLELDEFDALPRPAAPAAPSEPVPPPPPPSPAAEDPPEVEEEAEEAPEKAEKPMLIDEMDIPLESIDDPDTVNERAEPRPEDPIRIARANPMAPPQRPQPGRTRTRSGVSNKGITNFDAIQNEIAPYLKHVREQVELRWNEMLYTRYSGTSPVRAVIDCAINPRGELVSVTVVEPVGDRIYSALCREAVLKAGPFGAFPFAVPDIYKDKNLEIRWTFNFL